MGRVAGGKDRKIVVYCANFDCDASRKAAAKLDNTGFTDVLDYEGGTRTASSRKKPPEYRAGQSA
ncbi:MULTISPECIES: rhodanese-like domain-containing protein [unclassified Ectothiorhodospira]|uniref:rhodanese-like domain-containing protein n=1 Tax=unclassified Ectothiorhodospira TaxID=2684909 RepID=UPI001EE92087|nr:MULTISPECIES: rhodanese-like domain-containing protein [unclassified Ectothiorhodospira]MCG5516796.1 rhodanese-like domain-containing protein [Ectothiorhodospira sp. 9100]MCG5519784.1 rhodanese-like domain-containing protein [Ectothiorhodospira sp. 9905]